MIDPNDPVYVAVKEAVKQTLKLKGAIIKERRWHLEDFSLVQLEISVENKKYYVNMCAHEGDVLT